MTEILDGGYLKFRKTLLSSMHPIVEETQKDKRLGNALKNVVVDGDGPKFVKYHETKETLHAWMIFSGFLEIDDAFNILKDIRFYLSKAPRFKDIPTSRYLRFHIESYFNSMYILRERLRTFQRKVIRAYKRDPRISSLKILSTNLDNLLKGFEGIVDRRGEIVHKFHYVDEDLDRLELLEVLNDPLMPEEFGEYASKEQAKMIKNKWKATMRENEVQLERLLDAYFATFQTIVFHEDKFIQI